MVFRKNYGGDSFSPIFKSNRFLKFIFVGIVACHDLGCDKTITIRKKLFRDQYLATKWNGC